MLTTNDLNTLYEWAKETKFPCKKAPTIDGYCNKVIDYYWLKSVKKSTIIRQKYMSDEVYKIYKMMKYFFQITLHFEKAQNYIRTEIQIY